MKVGDYVRTEDGTITRIKMFYEKKWEEPELIYARFLCEDYEIYEYPRQAKSSPNIIDLIEVGDYVNGYKVLEIEKDYLFDYTEEINVLIVQNDEVYEVARKIYSDDIKSIVTKEQFSQMEYKIGGNDD